MRESCISSPLAALCDEIPESGHAVKEHPDVTSKADHTKSLTDPMRGRLLRGREKAGSYSMFLAHGYKVIHSLEEARVVELRWETHGYGQVVMSDPSHVDARH